MCAERKLGNAAESRAGLLMAQEMEAKASLARVGGSFTVIDAYGRSGIIGLFQICH